jgi:hypothetical protein
MRGEIGFWQWQLPLIQGVANSLSWEEGNGSREGERKTKCVFDGVNVCVQCF